MIHQLYMPKFGANIESGIIVEWLKEEGDQVTKGETIARVETAKSVFDLEAEESGILRKILALAGNEVEFNRVIAIIANEKDDIEPVLSSIASQDKDRSAEFVKKMDESVFIRNTAIVTKEKLKITPAARRLMRENNISEESLASIETNIVEEKDIMSLLSAQKVFIYGASTGAKQIMEIIKGTGKYQVIGIIDDNREFSNKNVWGTNVVGDFEWLKKRYTEDPNFGIMIASHSTNREKIYHKIKKHMPDVELPPIVDKRAILLSGVTVGESSLIEAGVILGHEVEIGKNVIVNIGARMSHNCIIGDQSHIAIGAALSAAVVLEKNVFVGAGAAVNPAVTIGKNTIISPNSAVLNDIPPDVVVSGVPGKVIGESKRGKQ